MWNNNAQIENCTARLLCEERFGLSSVSHGTLETKVAFFGNISRSR